MSYQIAILRHTYMPDLQGERSPRFFSDRNDNTVEFETVEEARAMIDEWNSEVVVLSNNESGRATYLIVEDVDGDYIRGGRNGDMSNYDWGDFEKFCSHDDACGECSGCINYMIDQDRQYLTNNAVYKS